MSRWNRGNNKGPRQGVKQLSKINRFAALDPDICSNYDDAEEETPVVPRRGRGDRDRDNAGDNVRHMRDNARIAANSRIRVDRLNYMSAAGRNSELVNKVKVIGGRTYGERWIIKQLNKQDIDDFKPILIQTNHKGEVEFYLRSNDAADAIKAISKRLIHQKTGDRVTFIVTRNVAPWNRLAKTDMEAIIKVVDSRYNEDSKAIDLSEFFLDPVFQEKGLHMLLSKNNVMVAVMERIDEKYGNITALSLKGNRLRNLDFVAMLVHVVKFVSVLDFSDNLIDSFEQLQKLRGLPVKMFFFEGNPVCEQLTKSSDYLNAVQQVFPKVIKLDGQDVPPSSHAADLDDEEEPTNEIPPRPGFYYEDESIRQLVETFIITYMEMYDGVQGSTTRKQLIPAYDENNSTFTLTIDHLPDTENVRYNNQDNFNMLIRTSHNIMKEDKWEKYRAGRSFKGSMEICVQLAKMPITNHFKESFVVDVHLKSEHLLGFTLQGLFEEGPFAKGGTVPVLNFFSRSFYVAPRDGNSVAIISDMLYISAITTDRMARYKMLINKCLNNGLASASSQQASIPTTGQPTDDIKQQMVEQFCKDSGMNAEYSVKCLEDNNWNYEIAGEAFLKIRDQIPPEAFTVNT